MTAKTTTAGKPRPILSVRDLAKHYPLKSGVVRHTVGHVKAVDGGQLRPLSRRDARCRRRVRVRQVHARTSAGEPRATHIGEDHL